MSQTETNLNFRNDRLSKNEFKVGDFIQFGRITYHVKETSEEPILLSCNNPDDEFNKTLDNTIGGALNFNNTHVIDSNPPLRETLALLDPPNTLRPRSGRPPNTPYYLQNPIRNSQDRSNLSVSNDISVRDSKSEDGRNNEEKETFTCRICLCDGDLEEEVNKKSKENALVSPCKCKGNILNKISTLSRYNEIHSLSLPQSLD
jgi:hypothetical protein